MNWEKIRKKFWEAKTRKKTWVCEGYFFVGWRREIEPPYGREIISRFAGNISKYYFLKNLFPAKPHYFSAEPTGALFVGCAKK